MTRALSVTLATVVALTVALIAAIVTLTPDTNAADTVVAPTDVGPAGSATVDFKAQSVLISYTDTSGGAGVPGQPITQAAAGEDFRVKVTLVFHNNGPDQAPPKFKFTLQGPPPGCQFVDPHPDGIYEFESTTNVPVSAQFGVFAEIKVRCNEPGQKTWTASVSILPVSGTDSNLSNNVGVGVAENPITITGATPTPTPTPFPTSQVNTPTPTHTPTSTPTPTGPTPTPPIGVPPTFPPPTNFPNEYQDPFFSVRPNGPSGLDPADILRAPGAIPIFTCLQLGLSCNGVDGQGPPVQDDLDALTFANERLGSQVIFFSTDSQSRGIDGSGTHQESNDNNQCTEEGNEYAEFPFGIGGDNRVFFPATALGLQEAPCPDQPDDDDDMDALAWGNNVQFPEDVIYFSLSPGSPTLAALGATPADVLLTVIGGSGPSIYRSAASLGLRAGDDIDGLCLWKVNGQDRFLLSLARNSPTLALIGASPGDLLFPGGPSFLPNVYKHGSRYGLLETDNVDAVKCLDQPPRGPQGDLDCDGDVDGKDALILLLFLTGKTTSITDCPAVGSGPANAIIGDLNCDGQVTNADLGLLLRAAGGLPVSLPAGCPPIGASPPGT